MSVTEWSRRFESLQTLMRTTAGQREAKSRWPAEMIAAAGKAGWLAAASGLAREDHRLSSSEVLDGWTRLAAADLASTFAMTQLVGAIKRVTSGTGAVLRDDQRQRLLAGDWTLSVGISQLTTSRRHLNRPAVIALPGDHGWIVRGTVPWVTGANHVDGFVIGATVWSEDASGPSAKPAKQTIGDELPNEELLLLISRTAAGVRCGPGQPLMAMSETATDEVELEDVYVPNDDVIAGPIPHVLTKGTPIRGGGAGGLQTSALALGLACAAVDFVAEQSARRSELQPIAERFRERADRVAAQLRGAAEGESSSGPESIRRDVNRLVLDATQTALTVSKGAGFVRGSDVERWCRQAMFFLVWSCPGSVAGELVCGFADLPVASES